MQQCSFCQNFSYQFGACWWTKKTELSFWPTSTTAMLFWPEISHAILYVYRDAFQSWTLFLNNVDHSNTLLDRNLPIWCTQVHRCMHAKVELSFWARSSSVMLFWAATNLSVWWPCTGAILQACLIELSLSRSKTIFTNLVTKLPVFPYCISKCADATCMLSGLLSSSRWTILRADQPRMRVQPQRRSSGQKFANFAASNVRVRTANSLGSKFAIVAGEQQLY